MDRKSAYEFMWKWTCLQIRVGFSKHPFDMKCITNLIKCSSGNIWVNVIILIYWNYTSNTLPFRPYVCSLHEEWAWSSIFFHSLFVICLGFLDSPDNIFLVPSCDRITIILTYQGVKLIEPCNFSNQIQLLCTFKRINTNFKKTLIAKVLLDLS